MIDNEKDLKSFNTRIRPEVFRRFKLKLAELEGQDPSGDWTQQRVVNELLEDWLGAKRTVQPAEPTKGHEKEIERLRLVLERGTPNEQKIALNTVQGLADTVQQRVSGNPSRSGSKPKPQKRVG